MGHIQYSEKYSDDNYEYRHVSLHPEVVTLLPKNRLLTEDEWRAIGVRQSGGWVHYAIHRPEPQIMLFRRPLNYLEQQAENQAQQRILAKLEENKGKAPVQDAPSLRLSPTATLPKRKHEELINDSGADATKKLKRDDMPGPSQ